MDEDIKKPIKLVTVNLTIGKSKELISYIFKDEDFLRMEDKRLFLKNDTRVLKLTEEQIRNLIFQCNFL